MAGGVEDLEGVVPQLQCHAVGEGDVGLADLLLPLGQQLGNLGGILALQQIQVILIGGLVKGGGDLVVAIHHLLVGDDGGAFPFQIGVTKDVVDVGLGVDHILDTAAFLLGKIDHLLQLGDPLCGVDEHSALASEHHGRVAAPDAGEGIHMGGDLLHLNVRRADGLHIISKVTLPNSNNFQHRVIASFNIHNRYADTVGLSAAPAG